MCFVTLTQDITSSTMSIIDKILNEGKTDFIVNVGFFI